TSAIGAIYLATMNSNIAVSGSGSISLSTQGDISLGNGASVTAASGAITLSADSDFNGTGTVTLAPTTVANWSQQSKLSAADGAAHVLFGYDLAISSDGQTAIVGAPYDDISANADQGSVYVFVRNG